MRTSQLAIKHGIDKVAALFLLVVASPILAAISVAIKASDRGAIFFKQARPGLHGEEFLVWKFRSMVTNADDLLDEIGMPTADRVTPVGRFLRRTSLDEVPQLINIVKGDMSFIGPRPPIPQHVPRYTDQQRGRFRMRPGITGLAQVSGRNSLPWSQRIEFDNEYIDNYSLLLDLKIALRTVRVVLTGSGQSEDRNADQIDDLGPPRS